MKTLNKFLYIVSTIILPFLSNCSDSETLESQICEQDIEGNVSGIVSLVYNNENLSGFQVRGAIVNGSVSGTTDADLNITSVDEDGTIHFEGSHVFYKDGKVLFKTSDKGKTTAWGDVENHLTIVEGKSGEFTTTGNVNLQTGDLNLNYKGKACLQ